MNAKLRRITFLFALAASLSTTLPAFAQTDDGATPAAAFTQQQLDQMLAPVALYPDALLAQVLTAATYPLEIVEAARWSQAHPDLAGTDAVAAADAQDWDPNVKALLAFPDLLQTMNDQLAWTEQLGNAFLAEQAQVMDTVQALRQRAESAGNLDSGGELRVDNDDGSIDIEPAAPDLVYVPYYDPTTIYGDWWWPAYPPVYWSVWPGYGWQNGFAWGSGVAIGAGFFCDNLDWHHHRVDVYDRGRPVYGHDRIAHNQPSRIWQHAPEHRRGVAYRNPALDNRFGRERVAGPNAAPEAGNGRLPPTRIAAPAYRETIAAPAGVPRGYAGANLPRMAPPMPPAPREVVMPRNAAPPMPEGARIAPANGGGVSVRAHAGSADSHR